MPLGVHPLHFSPVAGAVKMPHQHPYAPDLNPMRSRDRILGNLESIYRSEPGCRVLEA